MQLTTDFSFGSDPEFMITDNNGGLVSALDILEGASSMNRIQLGGHEFYPDNVLAECSIKPGFSKNEVLLNVREAIGLYETLLNGNKLLFRASDNYPDSALTHPLAKMAGCSADMCAYQMKMMNGEDGAAKEIRDNPLRSCGGHIHVGHKVFVGDVPQVPLAIMTMDLLLGIPSLFLDKDPTSHRRRKLYGKAGRFRFKPYGFEYRSLSHFWLKSEDMTSLIYDITQYVVSLFANDKWQEYWSFNKELLDELEINYGCLGDAYQFKICNKQAIKQAIDENDIKAAYGLLDIADQVFGDFAVGKDMIKGIKKEYGS